MGEDFNCGYCGEDVGGPKPWRRTYCSSECHSLHKSEKAERTKFTCRNCGEEFERLSSQLQLESAGTFCSRGCSNQFHHTGKDNSQYIDGRDSKRSYGPNWSEQRRKALERDYYRCRSCNLSNEECENKYGKGLSVHHQTPRRYFDDLKKANRLRNLISVCPPCHVSLEREIE